VIVAATGCFTGAVVGDLLLGIAGNRGVVGFVTDSTATCFARPAHARGWRCGAIA